MLIKPSEWYNDDYFYPNHKTYIDEFGVSRIYYGPSKEWGGFGLIANWIKENFPNAKTLYDIGCSAGSFVDYSSRIGFNSFGVDISRFAVNNCVEGARGKLHIQDITSSNPVKQSDLVTSMDLMEHIYEKDLNKVIEYIKKSMAPGATFFSCICTARHENEIWQHSSEQDPIPQNRNWLAVSGHVNIKWMEDWMKIFSNAGFTMDYEKMFKFQIWRTRNELSQTDSWSIRNVYIGRI
jgi:cyclopropane fatty-acyl-phospholipid synthase-like methyltransferase